MGTRCGAFIALGWLHAGAVRLAFPNYESNISMGSSFSWNDDGRV